MKHLEKVLVIGSGPIIIGQGAEFDYSGTQACGVLKEEGLKVILANNNPATIMTDKTTADAVYLEPLNVQYLERIIETEKPDGIIVGMGGQTALNLAMTLYEAGVLEKHGVEVLGTSIEGILKAEDRELFKQAMEEIDQPIIESKSASTFEEAVSHKEEFGLPLVVRPAFTLGGTGGGIVETEEAFNEIVKRGLALSPVSQVLIEKSLVGWKEIEYEIVRDKSGNVITVCNMENIDPLGIHTGDSIVVAPSQTLSDKEYQMLRAASLEIAGKLGIVGGCNVQIALDPHSFDYFIIEVNPRVSRSSALASKATGYPIAKVAAKIALGYDLDEIKNDVTGKTMACFEPSLDYCAVKIPKWPFEKFPESDRKLGTSMKATGEIMAIGNNFESALLKGIRSLEIDQYGMAFDKAEVLVLDHLLEEVKFPSYERIFYVGEALRRQVGTELLNKITGIDRWFLEKFRKIVEIEKAIHMKELSSIDYEMMKQLKQLGFSDKYMGEKLCDTTELEVRAYRKEMGVETSYKMVDTCSGEFEANTPYYYSSYDQYNENEISGREKIIVLGSGPIRIGQGVEFDYCSVHGILSIKEEGYEGVIINNNPETVSTDFNVSDKLYFEPITLEDTLNIIDAEKPYGVIVQYGGQTGIKLANELHEAGVRILGTSSENIHASEDRDLFYKKLMDADITVPHGVGVSDLKEGLKQAGEIGYPVMVRPNYVIGGLGMEIIHSEEGLITYLENAFMDSSDEVLIDKYLTGMEIEVDAVCDGEDIIIPGVMEHLERAGVHSGDSISIYPAKRVSEEHKEEIIEITEKIAKILEVKGLLNIQFVLCDGKIYVLEVNLRASRTIPFISKITGIPMIKLSTKVILGAKLKDLGYGTGLVSEGELTAIKLPVFSMEKLTDTEVALGPNMKSTGEVMAIDTSYEKALYKGFVSTKQMLKEGGSVLLDFDDHDDLEEVKSVIKSLKALGKTIIASSKSKAYLNDDSADLVDQYTDDVLNTIDQLEIHDIISLATDGKQANKTSFNLRRYAIEKGLSCHTSIDTVVGMIDAIHNYNEDLDINIVDICKLK